MRRMRDIDWRLFRKPLLIFVLGIALIAGIHGVTRYRNSSRHMDAAGGQAKSFWTAAPAPKQKGRAPAASEAAPATGFLARLALAVEQLKGKALGVAGKTASEAPVRAGASKTRAGIPALVAAPQSAFPSEELVPGAEEKFAEKEFGSTGGGEYCTASEFRGPGIQEAGVSAEEWASQMKAFHAAKKELLDWLAAYKSQLPIEMAGLAEKMAAQVKELRIQRPPTQENPDLGWRGIGVLMRDAEGKLVLRLGGGFPTLTKRAPDRARFELIRLLAQSWAPCELARLGEYGSFWQKTIECLGVQEAQSCADGSYSEAGWAVSSAVAAIVSPPPCTLPIFRSPKYRACLDVLKPTGGAVRVPASGGAR